MKVIQITRKTWRAKLPDIKIFEYGDDEPKYRIEFNDPANHIHVTTDSLFDVLLSVEHFYHVHGNLSLCPMCKRAEANKNQPANDNNQSSHLDF